jgi:hypothetical protein
MLGEINLRIMFFENASLLDEKNECTMQPFSILPFITVLFKIIGIPLCMDMTHFKLIERSH